MLRLALAGLLTLPLCAVQLELEVAPSAPITRRVLFVVDRSGSMHGDHFSRALAAVRGLIEYPTDDLEVAVIAFNDVGTRWPGKPERGGRNERSVPVGWAALPSDTAIDEAEAWLAELGAGGDTLVIPALRQALAEQRDELSVVLVSDGLFGRERTTDVLAAIASAQADRERLGLDRAVIGVYGLGACQTVLTEIANAGAGGYVREEVPLDDEFGALPTPPR